MQPEVQQRRRGQARGVALRAEHHPLDVVVDRLRAAGRRWSDRSATPARCVRSPPRPAPRPRRRAGRRGGCRPGSHPGSAPRAPRRPAAGSAAPARRPGSPRCDAAHVAFRLVGEFGAGAAQRVALGHLVIRHRGQRRRVGVHAEGRARGVGQGGAPTTSWTQPSGKAAWSPASSRRRRNRSPSQRYSCSAPDSTVSAPSEPPWSCSSVVWPGTQLISQTSSSSSACRRVNQRASVGSPPAGSSWLNATAQHLVGVTVGGVQQVGQPKAGRRRHGGRDGEGRRAADAEPERTW